MLDDDRAGGSAVIDLLKQLRCEIELPASAVGYFDVPDPPLVMTDDSRRFARRPLKGFAALEHSQTFAALPRATQWYKVYTKDISHGGLAFLHGERLFPRERMRMLLPDPRIAQVLPHRRQCLVEVARCRRLGPHCYEIGAIFVDELT